MRNSIFQLQGSNSLWPACILCHKENSLNAVGSIFGQLKKAKWDHKILNHPLFKNYSNVLECIGCFWTIANHQSAKNNKHLIL